MARPMLKDATMVSPSATRLLQANQQDGDRGRTGHQAASQPEQGNLAITYRFAGKAPGNLVGMGFSCAS
jgi:hypothetical protein